MWRYSITLRYFDRIKYPVNNAYNAIFQTNEVGRLKNFSDSLVKWGVAVFRLFQVLINLITIPQHLTSYRHSG